MSTSCFPESSSRSIVLNSLWSTRRTIISDDLIALSKHTNETFLLLKLSGILLILDSLRVEEKDNYDT